MNRQEILKRLRAAKSAHLQWRARAQALVAGLDMDEEKIPLLHTDCKFGQWYYGEGQILNDLPSFRAIEEPHEILHAVYLKLFQTLHGENDRSAWRRLFGGRRISPKRLEEAKGHLNELIEISRTLLAAIEVLESEIKSMRDQEIEALC